MAWTDRPASSGWPVEAVEARGPPDLERSRGAAFGDLVEVWRAPATGTSATVGTAQIPKGVPGKSRRDAEAHGARSSRRRFWRRAKAPGETPGPTGAAFVSVPSTYAGGGRTGAFGAGGSDTWVALVLLGMRTRPRQPRSSRKEPCYPGKMAGRIGSARTGGGHTCGARADGSVWCWGAGAMGQRGDGAPEDRGRYTPTRVVWPTADP
jgi:hypothetical protein